MEEEVKRKDEKEDEYKENKDEKEDDRIEHKKNKKGYGKVRRRRKRIM